MKIHCLLAGSLIVLLSWTPFVHAVDVLSKVDDVANSAPNEKARKTGRQVIFRFLAECEFHEPCLLGLIYRLREHAKTDPNPMYLAYVKFLDDQKQEIAKSALACRGKEKQAVRHAYAICVKERAAKEEKLEVLNRSNLDKMSDEQDVCIREKMLVLAKENNIFAQAILVNQNEQSRNQKEMNYWYEKMTQKQGTEEFNTYLKCPDIP